jgi:hypothetical protein
MVSHHELYCLNWAMRVIFDFGYWKESMFTVLKGFCPFNEENEAGRGEDDVSMNGMTCVIES